VALALALRHPGDVAALVTAAGYTHAVRPRGTPLGRLLGAGALGRLFRAALLAPAVALVGPLVLRRIAAPERAPRDYARAALALNYDPARSAGDADDVAAVERDLRLLAPEYPTVAQPLIAVHGAEDRVLWPLQSERLAGAVPGAELRIIPGAGHLLPVTRAAELAAAVDDVARRAPSR
jgi:pimeloyl-ACP methyl ester carboxylesterase